MVRDRSPIEIGSTFGKWVVLSEVKKPKEVYYLCKCDCGSTREITKSNLKLGKSRSCNLGKCRSTASTHGLTYHPLYGIWCGIRSRIKNPTGSNSCYAGITICTEWASFELFYDWSINSGYSTGLSIDREDRNLGYSPTNCRWTDSTVQSQNRSAHKHSEIQHKGVFMRKPRSGKVIYAGTYKAPYYWIVIYNYKRHEKCGFSTPEEAYLDRCQFIKDNYDGLVYPD